MSWLRVVCRPRSFVKIEIDSQAIANNYEILTWDYAFISHKYALIIVIRRCANYYYYYSLTILYIYSFHELLLLLRCSLLLFSLHCSVFFNLMLELSSSFFFSFELTLSLLLQEIRLHTNVYILIYRFMFASNFFFASFLCYIPIIKFFIPMPFKNIKYIRVSCVFFPLQSMLPSPYAIRSLGLAIRTRQRFDKQLTNNKRK